MSSGKSNCEISQQIEGFDVFSGVIGNVEFQGIRGIRNDDSTVLKEKDGEGTKMMMEQDKKHAISAWISAEQNAPSFMEIVREKFFKRRYLRLQM